MTGAIAVVFGDGVQRERWWYANPSGLLSAAQFTADQERENVLGIIAYDADDPGTHWMWLSADDPRPLHQRAPRALRLRPPAPEGAGGRTAR